MKFENFLSVIECKSFEQVLFIQKTFPQLGSMTEHMIEGMQRYLTSQGSVCINICFAVTLPRFFPVKHPKWGFSDNNFYTEHSVRVISFEDFLTDVLVCKPVLDRVYYIVVPNFSTFTVKRIIFNGSREHNLMFEFCPIFTHKEKALNKCIELRSSNK